MYRPQPEANTDTERMQETIFTADLVPQAPDDPHYGLRAAFRADSSEQKVDLIIGVYRDDDGKPWVLPVVKKVKISLSNTLLPNQNLM
jgi:aspartate aminotransferase